MYLQGKQDSSYPFIRKKTQTEIIKLNIITRATYLNTYLKATGYSTCWSELIYIKHSISEWVWVRKLQLVKRMVGRLSYSVFHDFSKFAFLGKKLKFP